MRSTLRNLMPKHLFASRFIIKRSILFRALAVGLGLSFVSTFAVESAIASDKKDVRMTVMMEYDKFPLKMQILIPNKEKAINFGETAILPLDQPFPASGVFLDGTTRKTGGNTPFMMAIENRTDATHYFFASTHILKPDEAGFGIRIACLCVHKIFSVPPKSKWYRIGNINLSNFTFTDSVTILHRLHGTTLKEIEDKKMQRLLYRGVE